MITLPAHGPHQRIGLFGGSFNPAHEGHRQVALYALKRLKLDWVWWLVSPQNPLKPTDETADYELRLAETRAMADHPQFVVSDVEQQIGTTYTAQTIAALKAASQAHFVWIMGADSLANFHHWRDWAEIMTTVPIAVLARPGYSAKALESVAATQFRTAQVGDEALAGLADKTPPAWAFVSMPLRKESSTAIRARRKSV
jgi:nicotinate-nucleotide adenylyltransferase